VLLLQTAEKAKMQIDFACSREEKERNLTVAGRRAARKLLAC
jgi:hypothetical protein